MAKRVTLDPETGERIETELTPAQLAAIEPPAIPLAQQASGLSLSASALYLALEASGLLAIPAGEDADDWLLGVVSAAAIDDQTKARARLLLKRATRFPRQDPEAPGLLEAIAALLPRADGGVGLTAAEIDQLYLDNASLGAPSG